MKIVLLKGRVFLKLIQIRLCICTSQDCTQGLPFTVICCVLLSSMWKIISAVQPPNPQVQGTPCPFHSESSRGLPAGGAVWLSLMQGRAPDIFSQSSLLLVSLHSHVQASVSTSLVQLQTFDSQIRISTSVTRS